MHTTTCPRTVTLWTPPHRRLFAQLSEGAWRLIDAWRGWAQRQQVRRRTLALEHALADLDDRTRRDLGLSERAALTASRWRHDEWIRNG